METSDEALVGLLLECPLFKGMSSQEVHTVLRGHLGRIKYFSAGSLIAQAGEKVSSLNILLRGSVKGEMVDYTGKVIKIEDIDPPRPLAPAFLFGSRNRYPVNISAGEEVELLSIPHEHFLGMLQKSEKVLVNFINIISSRSQFLSNKIKFLSFTTIKGKLAQYLLDLRQKANSDLIMMPLSQAQLSELFGVARPSVGRAISELNRDKIIRTDGKQVKLLDLPRLSALLK